MRLVAGVRKKRETKSPGNGGKKCCRGANLQAEWTLRTFLYVQNGLSYIYIYTEQIHIYVIKYSYILNKYFIEV